MGRSAAPGEPRAMDAETFLAWAMEQDGRYELDAGEVVAMSPERLSHSRVKFAMVRLLREAIRATGLPCEAVADGMAVRIDSMTVYQPDASVVCGPRLDDAVVSLSDPVIVVEVRLRPPGTSTAARNSRGISGCRPSSII